MSEGVFVRRMFLGNGDIHVLPLNDLREHVEARECACQPRLEQPASDGSTVVVHNSFDGRELVEQHGLQ